MPPRAVTSARSPDIEIAEVDRVDIAVAPWSWRFAVERREEIERNFVRRRRERPALWNGRVILLNRYEISDRVLRGSAFETDYASFLAWRDWDFADPGVFNMFAAAALRTADGAYLVGEMGPHTAGAGMVYFPCGTPEPHDIAVDGTFDAAGSLSRELLEETGLDIGAVDAEPGWIVVRDRGFFALMKRVTAPESAEALREKITRYLARESQPELCGIRVVRGRADIDPRMPPFMVAFLENAWR